MSGLAVASEPPPPPPPTCDPPHKNATGNPGNTESQCLLPYIDPANSGSLMSVVKSETHPIFTTNDFLPSDLLLALKRQDNINSPCVGTKFPSPSSKSHKPPANMWNYQSRRNRLKHLTDAPPCVCGAGRDISFLYDYASNGRQDDSDKFIPADSIIPEEYHIIKHPGVAGLEYHDDKYVTQNENHDYHMTVFPSTKPSGRHEAVMLKHTFDLMLQQAGVPTEITDSDLKGPTEMHNLLELVEKEQIIYNIVFHEVIRQVSIHCVERGELLASIRQRYANLLDRIPRQVKSLHDQVVAQKALDRKLTNELKKFKSKIASLTEELSLVKDHDTHVTDQSKVAEENLATALATSHKNSEMLKEYHDLYELQRRRLENQISQLSKEQELWQQASYNLAKKVTEEYKLQTLQRLQLSEKCWSKLARHFAILLSSKDTQQLSEVQDIIQDWKQKLNVLLGNLQRMESNMKEKLKQVRDGLTNWIEEHEKSITPEGIKIPSHQCLSQLWSEMKVWQELINKESENFAGETLLSHQDELKQIISCVEKWSDVSLQVFVRHRKVLGTELEEDGVVQQNKRMVQINEAIDLKLAMCSERITGENGVAIGFVHLITPLETWDTKLSIILMNTDKKIIFPDSDWRKFGKLLKELKERIENVIVCIGSVSPPPPSIIVSESIEGYESKEEKVKSLTSMTLEGVIEEVENWCYSLSYAIDADDTRLSNQISKLHYDLLKWTINLLLVVTQTRVEGREEEEEEEEYKKEEKHHQRNLRDEYIPIVEMLTVTTKQVTMSCMDAVREIVDSRIQDGYPNPEEESSDLKRMGDEVLEWIKLSNVILNKELKAPSEEKIVMVPRVTGGILNAASQESSETRNGESSTIAATESEITKGMESSDEVKEGRVEGRSDVEELHKEEEGEKQMEEDKTDVEGVKSETTKSSLEMNVMGVDDNIHKKSFRKAIEESDAPSVLSITDLGLSIEEEMPKGRETSREDVESLVILLDRTTASLQEQESLTKKLDEKVETREKELEEANKMILCLEEELRQVKTMLEQQNRSNRSKYSNNKGNSGKKSITTGSRGSIRKGPPS